MTINTNAVFIGDSITLGARTTPATVTAAQRYSKLIADRYGLTEINKGVSSDTSTGMKNRFETDVTAYAPAIVSIMCGTNDWDTGINVSLATFEANLRWMIERSLEIGARVVLWTPPANTDTTTADQTEYLAVIRKMPVYYPVHLIDAHARFAELKHFNGSLSAYLMDQWHPYALGHSELDLLTAEPCHVAGFLLAVEEPEDPEEPPTSSTIFSEALTTDSNGWTGYQLRTVISGAEVADPPSGTTGVCVKLKGGASGWSSNAVYIGGKGSGAADFSGTPAQLKTAGGSGSISVPANGELLVYADFVPTGGQPIVIAADITGGGSIRFADSAGFKSYWKSGTGAANTTLSGYYTWGGSSVNESTNHHVCLATEITAT